MKRLALVLSCIVLFASCQSVQHMTKDSKNVLIGEFEFIATNYFSSFDGTYRDGVTLKYQNLQTMETKTVVTNSWSGLIYIENLPPGWYRFTQMVLPKGRIGSVDDLRSGLTGWFPQFEVKDGGVNLYGKIGIKWDKTGKDAYNHFDRNAAEIKEHFTKVAPNSEYLSWDWTETPTRK